MRRARGLAVLVLLAAPQALAQQVFTPSPSDFGGIGLLQTRTARFGADGDFSITVSNAEPYQRYSFTSQFLPWLEGTFRYSDINNRPFLLSAPNATGQSFKDRAVDLKLRLMQEGRYRPQVAIGLSDLGGTQQFGSEFVVASKRFYNLDFSLGLGWGNMGTQADLPNPLTWFSKRFETRKADVGQGGQFNPETWFHGERISVFGGVEWLTPIPDLRLKLELDGNSYQDEPLGNRFEQASRFNVGVEYDLWSWLHVAVAAERGNTLMLRATARSRLGEKIGVPKLDPAPPAVAPRPPTDTGLVAEVLAPARLDVTATPTAVADRLFSAFEGEGYSVGAVDIIGDVAVIGLEGGGRSPLPGAEERAARAALLSLPPTVSRVRLDLPGSVGAREFLRRDVEQAVALAGRPVLPRPRPAMPVAADPDLAAAVFDAVARAGFSADAVERRGLELVVHVTQARFRERPRVIGRVARAVAAVAPPEIELITVVSLESGLETNRVSLLRREIEKGANYAGSPEELWASARIDGPSAAALPEGAIANPHRFPAFTWSLAPRFRQHIGGAESFAFYQFWLQLNADLRLTRYFSLGASLGRNIYNNFDEISLASDSVLPHVRSDIVRYLQEGENNIVNLHADYMRNLAPDWYGRVSAGLFEEMFGGFGTEVLYRPWGKRWAAGLDLNYVWQRDFDQRLSFRNYETATGHASLYYELPVKDLLATVHAGRYLARDWGTTFELSRTFESGVSIGAWATFTNVSAAEFGEGSFDKGFYINIPLDLFFTTSNRNVGRIAFRPLTRDGGQRLGVPNRLYSITAGGTLGALGEDWGRVLD